MIDLVCYGLLVGAWVIDLVTPQLFVVSIVFNGPIALSSIALRRGLTLRLTIAAEIANIIAAYVDAARDGYQWSAIALGDRALLAASFLLVGFLTIRAQENARHAGEAGERERAIDRERALRHAMERVRATLNMELVLRNAVTEAAVLTGADAVTIAIRANALEVPERFEVKGDPHDVQVHRAQFGPRVASLAARSQVEKRVVGDSTLVASLDVEDTDIVLLLSWETHTPDESERAAVQDFVDNLSVAVQQARLFIRLAEQNDEIAVKNEELQARSDVIRDIVYALAHDLRTPLVAADTTMNQALAGAYGDLPQRYQDVLRSSMGSNADLRRLVETLLMVARYEAGEDSHAFSPVVVSRVVDRVVEEMLPLASARKVHLTIEPVDTDVEVTVDGDELRRAVINLVANALEATPESGRVNVAVRKIAGRAIIEVSDNGYGVSEERRSGLFQRFGGKRGGEGTGLGLYIVRRIAEKYGGTASYAPVEPRGSRFTLELPA